MRQNIYMGVDGVILTRGVAPALHLDKFLKYVLDTHPVFWLTYRCQGDNQLIIKYLSQFFSVDTVGLLKRIRSTSFRIDKTEAIDFKRRFLWLDCELFASEANVLKEHSMYSSWIEMNLIENPHQLLDLTRGKLRNN